jgi:hypothetical protein
MVGVIVAVQGILGVTVGVGVSVSVGVGVGVGVAIGVGVGVGVGVAVGVGVGVGVAVGVGVGVGVAVGVGVSVCVGVGVGVGVGVVTGSTHVLWLAVLLVQSSSTTSPVTEAVFVIVPVTDGTTRITTLAFAPSSRIPSVQVIVLTPEQTPWLGKTELRDTLAGKVSERNTPVAGSGPALEMVSV